MRKLNKRGSRDDMRDPLFYDSSRCAVQKNLVLMMRHVWVRRDAPKRASSTPGFFVYFIFRSAVA